MRQLTTGNKFQMFSGDVFSVEITVQVNPNSLAGKAVYFEGKVMSETQLKVTDTFHAVDDEGNNYHVTEYTLFRHTTDTNMKEDIGGDIKEYRLGNDELVKRITANDFETEDGKIIHRQE